MEVAVRGQAPEPLQEERPDQLRPGGPSVQALPSVPWVPVGFPTETTSVQPTRLRFNRNGFGSTGMVSVEPKLCRFNRSGFGSTETVSVQPKGFQLNRRDFG